MFKQILIVALVCAYHFNALNCQTIQERLGYDIETKLLIVHADDLGVSRSENAASFDGMKNGYITSASVLMPTPLVSGVIAYISEHPDVDLGIHVCMTSEWSKYKWGPVSDIKDVPSLVDEKGNFYDNSSDFAKNAIVKEVGIEVRAQIDLAIEMGINPSHLDAHMGCMYQSPALLEELIKISNEYGIPIAATLERIKSILPNLETDDMFFATNSYGAQTQDYDSGMFIFYTQLLLNLDPGLNTITVHSAFDDAEMQEITIGKTYWGSEWRQQDYNFFTSDACQQIIKMENIQLITWREVKDKLMK